MTVAAAQLLEELRYQLKASAVAAEFGTRHGVVELRADADGVRVLVNGQEVPRVRGGAEERG